MCGIVGMVAKQRQGFYTHDVNVFSQMLVADSVRGIDGTGVFGTYGTGSVGWLKVAAHPYALLMNDKFDSWARAMTQKFDMVVGHNRKATAGGKTHENAHPFIHEHIILVHNGVVHNHKSMAETEVDSHAIAHSIVDKGHEETIAKLEGAFALVWFDMKDRTLRIVRNSQRPLFLVETPTQFVFASEGSMLAWLGDRNNNAKWNEAKQLEPGQLVSISQITKEMTTKTVKLYSYTSNWQPTRHNHHPFDHEFDTDFNETASEYPPAATGDDEDDVDPITVAIRKDMPDLSEAEVLDVENFISTYGDGTVVTFEAKSMVPWSTAVSTIAGYNLEGTLRGNPNVTVRASFEGSNVFNDVQKLLNKRVLRGTVYGAMVNPSSGKRSLHIRHVTGLDTYVSFNGTSLTADEWVKIADTHTCTRCSKKLKISDVATTSVNIKNPENIRVFCPTCVKEHMTKLSPEHRERIKAVNESVKGVLEETEKEWNLRGASHGS